MEEKKKRIDLIKVLIIEDDPMASTLFQLYIEHSSRYVVVGSAASASVAELYCVKNSVDLVLMDVCTELSASGLVAAAKIKRSYPQIKIIIMTSQPEYDFLSRAKDAGIDSFWYKEPSEDVILEIMDRTMNGERVYPNQTPVLKIGETYSTDFTPSEIRVLRELTSGDTDEEIAERLNLSTWTVRKYIKVMLEKTNLKSRTQLAVEAQNSGIVIRGY